MDDKAKKQAAKPAKKVAKPVKPTHIVLYPPTGWRDAGWKTFATADAAIRFVEGLSSDDAKKARIFPLGDEVKVVVTVELA